MKVGIFLSHASEDHTRVRAVKRRLEDAGYICWMDRDRLAGGQDWDLKIKKAIAAADLAMVFVSERASRKEGYYQKEIKWIRDRQDRLPEDGVFTIPVRLEACEWPFKFNRIQNVDLFGTEGFSSLLRALEALPETKRTAIRGERRSGDGGPDGLLLLATDRDLGEAREQTADFLKQRLGLRVITGYAGLVADPGDFELTVLIHAWRWEGGVLAETWQAVDPEKRGLFLVSTECPIPNRSLLEWTKEVDAFHIDQPSGIAFDKLEALPRLVHEWVVKKIGSAPETDDSAEIEQGYLQLHVDMWQRGRTQSKAYRTESVYAPSLYVPLDGMSSRWQRDSDGRVVRRPEEREAGKPGSKRDGAQLEKQEPLRLGLTKWASLEVLPWLAISGAPGAGKTVFLTRLAAALAQLHLEGSQDLEADLHSGAMGSDAYSLPIPVLLEATQLAGKGQNLDKLVSALSNALAGARGAARLALARVERDLVAGRYLLLVDALDEIADEQQRRDTLFNLRSLKKCLGATRLVLTTRSARYTGPMPFGPELEVVEVCTLNEKQRDQLCMKFCDSKGETPEFHRELLEAVTAAEEQAGRPDEPDLITNPLLLTSFCTVYYQMRRLPDDRAELLDRLVDDLCGVRDPQADQEWRLSPNEKRDLLERLALTFAETKVQSMALIEARAVIAETLPEGERGQRIRLDCTLQWLVEQTGLLYYQGGEQGEMVRFHHRLFRDYLTASCLARAAGSGDALIGHLYEKGWLTDPYHGDVAILLPGAVNSREKVLAMAEQLTTLIQNKPEEAGRLTALLAAMLVESRSLFKQFDEKGFVGRAVDRYKTDGAGWDRETRLLFLEKLGRLGDPRLDWSRSDRWVYHPPGAFTMGDRDSPFEFEKPEHRVRLSSGFWLSRFPATNADFKGFIDEGGYQNQDLWSPEGWDWQTLEGEALEDWWADLRKRYTSIEKDWKPFYTLSNRPPFWRDRSFNGPNQPVVGINWFEAEAWCNWLEKKLAKKGQRPTWLPVEGDICVGLPSEAQWEYAAGGSEGRRFPWEAAEPTPEHANFNATKIQRTTPVGAFPAGTAPSGLADMAGNVWEWCRDVWNEGAYQKRKEGAQNPLETEGDLDRRVVRGGSWLNDAVDLRASCRYRGLVWSRSGSLGFRPCLWLVGGDEHGP